MSIGLTDILAPLGSFPLVEDVSLKGGFQAVDDIAARDAITSVSRKAGMLVWAEAEGSLWQLDADLVTWVRLQLNPPIPIVMDLVKGRATDDTGVPTSIGAEYVDASTWPVSRTVSFRCVLESSSVTMPTYAAEADLYDLDDALGGGPGVVVGSPVDNSAAIDPQVPAMVEANVTTAFAGFTGSGVFEVRLWINTVGGGNMVTCKSAQLIVVEV